MPSQSRRHTKQQDGVSLIFGEGGSSGQASAVHSGQSTLLFIVKPNAVSQHGDSAGVMYTNTRVSLDLHTQSKLNLRYPHMLLKGIFWV